MNRENYWTHHVTAQAQSGLGAAEYCRKKGVSITSFYQKRQQFRKQRETGAGSLVPVVISQAAVSTPDGSSRDNCLCLRSNGVSLELPLSTPEPVLRVALDAFCKALS